VPLTIVATRLDDGVENGSRKGRAGGRPRFGRSARIFRQSSVKAVDTSTGSGRQHPAFVALAAGARRIYVCCAAGSTPARIDSGRPYEALLVAFGLSIRTRLRRDLAAVPSTSR